jgi:hypothetical protein
VPCPKAPCLRPGPIGPARAQARRRRAWRAAVAVGRQVPCSPSRQDAHSQAAVMKIVPSGDG